MPIILLEVPSDPSGAASISNVTLTDLESEILTEVGEDASDPQVWTGGTDLREALSDAIDEIGMLLGCFKTKILIKMEADVAFYSVGMGDGYPLWITDARVVANDNRLTPKSISQLAEEDQQFLLETGTPINYTPLSSDIVLFTPHQSKTTDLVSLSVVYVPYHYAEHNEYLTIRQETEQALIHYGKYHKLLGVKGSFRSAMSEYESYLKMVNQFDRAKSHSNALIKLRLGNSEDVRYGSKA